VPATELTRLLLFIVGRVLCSFCLKNFDIMASSLSEQPKEGMSQLLKNDDGDDGDNNDEHEVGGSKSSVSLSISLFAFLYCGGPNFSLDDEVFFL
jgi:hypothetical protein